MSATTNATPVVGLPAVSLFQSVVDKDYDGLVTLYASHARNSLVSYASMRSRWAHQQESYTKSEEKLDEFLLQMTDSSDGRRRRGWGPMASRKEDDESLFFLLQQLAGFIGDRKEPLDCSKELSPILSRKMERLVWESSSILSDTRPPADFCVYNKRGDTIPPSDAREPPAPPIFDGSVANATPPPLGGGSVGASGGSGTILHLACALDRPLMLAFFLAMGADGRSSHTAFRRLMIHEAACNGSIGCLALLLELGSKFSLANGQTHSLGDESSIPFFPVSLELPSATSLTSPGVPAPRPSIPHLPMNTRHNRRESRPPSEYGNYLVTLQQFQSLAGKVAAGDIDELAAARELIKDAILSESTRAALTRSCVFKNDAYVSRSFLRPHGSADGHGNTPLHWAAFKNETECVALLLKYEANPNARAHPSGWTPLHDAAYSNSSESIELLVDKGAHVDARANSGATPLCFAAQEDASNAADLLLKKGADLTARCAGTSQEDGHYGAHTHPHSRFSGYTPLHYCAHYNAHKASKILLGHTVAKVAMETPDLSGRLPIHVAVARGSSDVLRELLHAGARIDIRPNGTAAPSPRSIIGPNSFFALPETPVARRRPPSPESPLSPRNRPQPRSRSSSTSSPVTSPILRSMIPQEPVTSSKPWNCLTQHAIDECKDLISKAEQSWSPDRHLLFTPQDRKAVMELLRVGKRLEQQGVLFVDLWPQVLGFCGRGWFEVNEVKPRAIDFSDNQSVEEHSEDFENTEEESHGDECLTLPSLSR